MASIIECEYQYLSAFYDEKRVYPVKISVEKYNDKHIYNSKMYLVITVGNIKRENISFTRMQPKGESVCPETYSPSEISITVFVKCFKPNECGYLIVNLPDEMLDEMQKNKIDT